MSDRISAEGAAAVGKGSTVVEGTAVDGSAAAVDASDDAIDASGTRCYRSCC